MSLQYTVKLDIPVVEGEFAQFPEFVIKACPIKGRVVTNQSVDSAIDLYHFLVNHTSYEYFNRLYILMKEHNE